MHQTGNVSDRQGLRKALLKCAMCLGNTPQHPPTIVAPLATHLAAKSSQYCSGVKSRYSPDPLSAVQKPFAYAPMRMLEGTMSRIIGMASVITSGLVQLN